jgi:hypothetical protein
MDKGMGRARTQTNAPALNTAAASQEFSGVVRNGVVELIGGDLPEGTRVQVRAKK